MTTQGPRQEDRSDASQIHKGCRRYTVALCQNKLADLSLLAVSLRHDPAAYPRPEDRQVVSAGTIAPLVWAHANVGSEGASPSDST